MKPPWGPQRDVLGKEALGLTADTVNEGIPEQVLRIRENMRLAQARIDDLRDTRVPSEDHDERTSVSPGTSWPAASATRSCSRPSRRSCRPARSSGEPRNAPPHKKPSLHEMSLRASGPAGPAWLWCDLWASLQVLDGLPEAVTRSPAQLWSVLARSLGEQGADGRTALAWRWALTGTCPSPVTLSVPGGRPPDRGEILAEA